MLSTTAGDLELPIPRLRGGSISPSLLERPRRVDQSLFAVIMEACLHGTSARKVDDLVKALGADIGLPTSEVPRICADLDAAVAMFRDQSLAGQVLPHVFLDVTYCKARVNHRVACRAVVVATGRRTGTGRCSGSRSAKAVRTWLMPSPPTATQSGNLDSTDLVPDFSPWVSHWLLR